MFNRVSSDRFEAAGVPTPAANVIRRPQTVVPLPLVSRSIQERFAACWQRFVPPGLGFGLRLLLRAQRGEKHDRKRGCTCAEAVGDGFAATRTLQLTNPTGFAAELKILVEEGQDAKYPLDPVYPLKMLTVKLAPGESVSLKITPRGVSIDGEKEPISPLYFRTRNFSRNQARVESGIWRFKDDGVWQTWYSSSWHVKWASHDRPYAKPTRSGFTGRLGTYFLLGNFGDITFLPVFSRDAGPEVMIKDHLCLSADIGDLGFPDFLNFVYFDFRIGARMRISSRVDATRSYTCRYLPLTNNFEGADLHNISLGFAFK